MEPPIIHSGSQTLIDSLLSIDGPASGMLISNSIASLNGDMSYEPLTSITHGTKADMEAVPGLYMCNNTTFTTFASLVSLTSVLVTGNPDLSAESQAETNTGADSEFDFFGFGSNFRSQIRSEPQDVEAPVSEGVVEKYPFLVGPLADALDLGDDIGLVLDAAMSRSADSIFSADNCAAERGTGASAAPDLSGDVPESTRSPATMTILLYSPASVYSKDTALYTPYTTPQLVSASKVAPVQGYSLLKTLMTPPTLTEDTLVPSNTAVSLDVDRRRKMDATIVFEKWRQACLALAAFPSIIATAYVSHDNEDDTTVSTSMLRPDVAVGTINSALSTKIEPVSQPGALRGNKHLKLLAAISSISTASTISMSIQSIQSEVEQRRGTELHVSLDVPPSSSSSDVESSAFLGYGRGYGRDSMPSFAAVMTALVSCTPTLPSVDSFSSIPCSTLLRSSLSIGNPSSAPIRAISSVERPSGSMSTETEHAGLVAFPSQFSTPSESLDFRSPVKARPLNLPTREDINQPRRPLVLSFPSIQLTKHRLSTIREVVPSHAPSFSFLYPLTMSRSGVLSVTSSESAVLVTNPPSISPYSPHSMAFESTPFDQTPGTFLRLEAAENFPRSTSTECEYDSALEERLLPPLPPLAVSAFPCPPARKSRSRFVFSRIPVSTSPIISRRPAIYNATPLGFASRPPSGKVWETNIAHPPTPGRFHKVMRWMKF